MPTLRKILSSERKRVITGSVVNFLSGHEYTVLTGGRNLKAKSAITETIDNGSRVVMSYTDEGLFIVGKESLKNRSISEVLVDG